MPDSEATARETDILYTFVDSGGTAAGG